VWQPRPAPYPCTLVGVGCLHPSAGERMPKCDTPERWGDLFLLAWGHDYDPDQKLSIFDCATVLQDLGAKAVLLIDEGNDVFQQYFFNAEDLKTRFWSKKPSFDGYGETDKRGEPSFDGTEETGKQPIGAPGGSLSCASPSSVTVFVAP
jgi:hypothetical protein